MAPRSPKPKTETAQELLSEIAESASEGIKQGKEDAQKAVEESLPVIKRGLEKATYSASYYLAFGLIYTGKLAMEIMPEGGALRQGAADGGKAAREVFEQRKQAVAFSETSFAEPSAAHEAPVAA